MSDRARRVRAKLEEIGLLREALRICRDKCVAFSAVWSDSRERPLPYVRAQIYGLLRHSMLWSYPEVARFVEASDHSVVLDGVRRFCPAHADINEYRRRARLRRLAETVRVLKEQNRRAA